MVRPPNAHCLNARFGDNGFWLLPELPGPCALCADVERINRLAGGHEETISFRSAERDISADLRDSDSTEQLARRVPYGGAAVAQRAPCIARRPDISFDVAAQAIGSAFHPVDRAGTEQPSIRELVIGADIERIDFPLAACDGVARTLPRARDVELLEIRREGNAVRVRHLIFRDDEIEPA